MIYLTAIYEQHRHNSMNSPIKKLADNKFIQIKKITGGAQGTTTIIKDVGSQEKKLDEF